MRPSLTHRTCADTCPRSSSWSVSFSPICGTWGKITIAPEAEMLTSRTTCLRPRNSSTAVLEIGGVAHLARSSIERLTAARDHPAVEIETGRHELNPPHKVTGKLSQPAA